MKFFLRSLFNFDTAKLSFFGRIWRAPFSGHISEALKKPLANEILFGKLVKGGHVKVVLKDGKLGFEIEGDNREPGAPIIEGPAEEAAEALAD